MRDVPQRAALRAFVSDSECYVYAEALAERFKGLTYEAGFFVQLDGTVADHAWVRSRRGAIIDTTYSQFDRNVEIGIWPKGNPMQQRYHAWSEHHPTARPDFCLLRYWRASEPCQVPGCTWPGRLLTAFESRGSGRCSTSRPKKRR